MNFNNNHDLVELDFYIDIIEKFHQKNQDPLKTEIWKNQSLIKLMQLLERTKNRKLVTNALILIISLFEDVPPDLYDNLGIDVKELSSEERELLISQLKEEHIPN